MRLSAGNVLTGVELLTPATVPKRLALRLWLVQRWHDARALRRVMIVWIALTGIDWLGVFLYGWLHRHPDIVLVLTARPAVLVKVRTHMSRDVYVPMVFLRSLIATPIVYSLGKQAKATVLADHKPKHWRPQSVLAFQALLRGLTSAPLLLLCISVSDFVPFGVPLTSIYGARGFRRRWLVFIIPGKAIKAYMYYRYGGLINPVAGLEAHFL